MNTYNNTRINKPYISSQEYGFIIITLFILNPFISLLIALYYYNHKHSLYIFALFTCYYGLNVNPNAETDDLAHYLQILPFYNSLPFNNFFQIMSGVFSQTKDSDVDIYRNLFFFIFSRFTSDGHILMAGFGLVYGTFFAISISLFLKQSSSKNIFLILILLSFAFQLPLNMLGGVRYGTAAYLFFFGSIKFISDPKLKNFLITLLSCLIHFHFIALVSLLIIYHFLKKHQWFFFTSFFISFIPFNITSYIENFSVDTSSGLGQRAYSYTNKENVSNKFEFLQSAAWKVKGQFLLQEFYYYLLIMINLTKNKLSITITQNNKNIFLFSLLLYSFSNLTRTVPSLGERSLVVALIFALYFLYTLQKDNMYNRIVRTFSILAFLAAGLRIIISFRAILFSLDPQFYYGNFFLNIFK